MAESARQHVGVSADQEAWLKAAALRKYRIENGIVWSGVGDMLFPLPPLPGFSSLPEAVRPIVFHGVAQFAEYRVGQTAEGDVAKAVHDAIVSGEIPNAKTNDAFESLYRAGIAARVTKLKPELVSKTGSDEEKKVRKATLVGLVNSNADHEPTREKLFAGIIAEGKASATRATKERKRTPAKTAEVLELA